jgi:chromosome segregation ATPase
MHVEWLKKNWLAIATLGLSIFFSFILGRKSVQHPAEYSDGVREHLNQLRTEMEREREAVQRLREQLDQSELRYNELQGTHEDQLRVIAEQRENITRMDGELRDAERTLAIARQYHADTGTDIGGVGLLTERLRKTIDTHREQLEAIKVYNDCIGECDNQ